MQHETFFYSITDPEFFESLDRYRPTAELRGIVEQHCSEGWVLTPMGFWTYGCPTGHKPQLQGWKIHASGTATTAGELLRRIVPIAVRNGVAFKFCSDLEMVRLSTNKNWHRTGAGKFITLYPRETEQFVQIIDLCYQVTQDLRGPYIFTDRPYKDSQVIFYRYGAHQGSFRVDALGRHLPMILAPDGKQVSDQRVPYFRLPDWVRDPFDNPLPQRANDGAGEVSLKQVVIA